MYLIYGVGTLLPWQAVLNCMGFFIDIMPGYSPQFVFPFAVNSLVGIMQFSVPFIASKTTYKFRVNYLFFAMSILMVILPICSIMILNIAAKFWVCFLVLLFFPLFNGIIQGSTFGLTAFMPGEYIGILSVGPALAGLIMNFLRMVSLLAFPGLSHDQQVKSAILFFAIATAFLMICAACGFYEQKDPFYQHHIKKLEAKSKESDLKFGDILKKLAAGFKN